jgi:glycosyltransferase involved in cell wall biosynthesis
MLDGRQKILLIADVPGWIFERHCNTLKRHLSNEFEVTIKFQGEPFREEDYQLIYPLEWYMLEPGDIQCKDKYVTGIRSHLVWPDIEFSKFVQRLNDNFNNVHVVSQRLFNIFSPFIPKLSYTTHGVDTGFFQPSTIAGNLDGPVRIGWAGNRKSLGNKGFEEIIAPMGKLEGVELVFCGYSDKNLSIDEMKSFYDSIDVYVCASENFEGNNNSLMEAASMGRAIITTDNGTVTEYLEHQKNALIVNRDFQSFKGAILSLLRNRQIIARLGFQAQRAVKYEWDWRIKAEDYRFFFREALNRQNKAP